MSDPLLSMVVSWMWGTEEHNPRIYRDGSLEARIIGLLIQLNDSLDL